MDSLKNRHALLIITGGIAAYKSCYLIRELKSVGCEVQVVVTEAATNFITPLTLATLSGREVICKMFTDPPQEEPIHLKTAEWGEILVVAPATANYIGKLANGIADDIATTIGMVFQGQILIAPAMNTKMWMNPAVQHNVETLRNRGVEFIGPAVGDMSSSREIAGIGRMIEPTMIFNRIEELLANARWKGRKVLVTSGPTREAIDPVRFLSNNSSGRMGDAIARQTKLRGAETILIRGRGSVGAPPEGMKVIETLSASEMAQVVKREFESCDMLIMAAAVADWTVEKPASRKLKKHEGAPLLELSQTEDILNWAGRNRKQQVIVGFALETEDHLQGAKRKLTEKGLDIIALNDPTRDDSLFGGDTTKLTLINKNGETEELPSLPKVEAANRLLDAIEAFLPVK
ncbi:bifunctional phosphopantothenoylcysteine decarboxylase/phosphopantothenate--cysteine ligase CoaBC [bacterium]|nr:bifunctional phosphopantothenoylcysteine decarboxylase/phosphopantothenate--cysteine ligase CoaBC [bacterium]